MNKKKKITIVTLLGILTILIITFVILLAIENSNQYVLFNTDGGTKIERQVIDKDGKIEDVIRPTKNGYIFDGWYLDNTLTDPIDLKEYIFTETTTIYAGYTSFFSEQLLDDFYTRYIYELDNNYHSNYELNDYMTNQGLNELTFDTLIKVVSNELLKSETEYYNLFSKEKEVDDSVKDNATNVKLHNNLYESNGKFYYKESDKYINALDETEVLDKITSSKIWKLEKSYYTPKDTNVKKLYVEYSSGTEKTYRNVLSINETEVVHILNEVSFYGTIKHIDDEIYIDYDPLVNGFKPTKFLTYFDEKMEYFLFDKVFNTYYTKDYIRLMVEVIFEYNPEFRDYSDSNVEKHTSRVKNKYFVNIINFQDYLMREEDINNKVEEV